MKELKPNAEIDYVIAFSMIRYLYHTGKISKEIYEKSKKELQKKIVTIDISSKI